MIRLPSPKIGGLDVGTKKIRLTSPRITPTPNPIPQIPTQTSQIGGGFGTSIQKDPYSGRPFLTYTEKIPQTFLNKEKDISFTDSTRTAPSFDFTKPQKITREMLRNDRMPESVSSAIRDRLGAGYDEQLDHRIALTLAGSNQDANLKLIPSEKNQEFGKFEGELANKVISGEISLLDAQRQMAEKKGINLAGDEEKPKGLIGKLQNFLMNTPDLLYPLADLQEKFENTFTQFKDPVKAVESIYKAGSEALAEPVKSLARSVADVATSRNMSEGVGAGLDVINNSIATLLSPISALFSMAEKLPVVQPSLFVLNKVMEGIDNLAIDSISRVVDTIPDTIMDQRAKSNIKEPLAKTFSMVAQFGVFALAGSAKGKKPTIREEAQVKRELVKTIVEDTVGEVAIGQRIIESKAKEIVENAVTKTKEKLLLDIKKEFPRIEGTEVVKLIEAPKNGGIKTGEGFTMKDKVEKGDIAKYKTFADYNKAVSEFNLKPTPNLLEKLRKLKTTIDSIRLVPEKPSIIQSEQPAPVRMTLSSPRETIVPVVKTKAIESSASVMNTAQSKVTATNQPFPARNISGIAESKIGRSIEAKAIEQKITNGFKDVAGYDPITIKEQAYRSSNLINTDIQRARRIIRGEEILPENIRGTSLITAMEAYIKKNPSAELAYELANSRLISETSVAAQELRLAAERTPDSATVKLQEIKKLRETKAQRATKKTKSDIAKEIKKETEKVNLSKEDLSWNKFLDEITC